MFKFISLRIINALSNRGSVKIFLAILVVAMLPNYSASDCDELDISSADTDKLLEKCKRNELLSKLDQAYKDYSLITVIKLLTGLLVVNAFLAVLIHRLARSLSNSSKINQQSEHAYEGAYEG